jgi:hypothetical protein
MNSRGEEKDKPDPAPERLVDVVGVQQSEMEQLPPARTRGHWPERPSQDWLRPAGEGHRAGVLFRKFLAQRQYEQASEEGKHNGALSEAAREIPRQNGNGSQ